jgi:hypothetical protein
MDERAPEALVRRSRLLTAIRVVIAAAAITVALVMPGTARATHDGSGYWFWTGYLPKANGINYAYHAGGGPRCCSWVVIRMSWEPWTHDMRFIFLNWDGTWYSYWAQSAAHQNEWDISQIGHASDHRYGGCQNHVSWSWWEVWTNCHVRNYP